MFKKVFIFLLLPFFLISCFEEKKTVSDNSGEEMVKTEVKVVKGEFSPDGNFIAFTKEKFKGLYVKNLKSGEIEQISDADGAGYNFSWSPDSRGIAFREIDFSANPVKYFLKKKVLKENKIHLIGEFDRAISPPVWKDTIYSADTVKFTNISLADKPLSILKNAPKPLKFNVFTADNRVHIINLKTGVLKSLEKGSHSPKISENGKYLLYIHYDTIKILTVADSKTFEIGNGSSPSWVGSTKVVYTSTLDDGRDITFSEVFLFDLQTGKNSLIPVNNERIPLSPSISPDGKKLLFTDGVTGQLFLTTVNEEK
ncbi:MAG: TolB family protein [bacterium]